MNKAQAILIGIIGVATIIYAIISALIGNQGHPINININGDWLFWASLGIVELIISSHFYDEAKKEEKN